MAFSKDLLRTLRKCFGFGKGRTATAVKTENEVPAEGNPEQATSKEVDHEPLSISGEVPTTAVKTANEVPAEGNTEQAISAEVDREPLSIAGEVESTGDKKPTTKHTEGQLVSQADWGKWERKVSAGQEIFTIRLVIFWIRLFVIGEKSD